VDLAAGIKAALRGHRQKDVADRMGIAQNTVSRWVTGQATPDLNQIAQLETECGRPAGFVLNAPGAIDPVLPVPDAIALDARHSPEARAVLCAAYEAAVEASSDRAGGDPQSRA
jgi:transcriptional regulator with XRE-family HTH domain